jgi:methyl-accepting chemotaxis protein
MEMQFFKASRDTSARLDALNKSQAVIEFNMDGTIIAANPNFLNTLGYRLDEIQGKHHSMFVAPEFRDSVEYREFWNALRRGEFQAREFPRIAKGGKPVWIQASYNPLLDGKGKPFSVVKFATDITEQKLRNADYEGQIRAIQKSQAVIEFKTDGTILTANDNFLKTLGYSITACSSTRNIGIARPTVNSGSRFGAASIRRPSTNAWRKVAEPSGSWPPTIPFAMPMAP